MSYLGRQHQRHLDKTKNTDTVATALDADPDIVLDQYLDCAVEMEKPSKRYFQWRYSTGMPATMTCLSTTQLAVLCDARSSSYTLAPNNFHRP